MQKIIHQEKYNDLKIETDILFTSYINIKQGGISIAIETRSFPELINALQEISKELSQKKINV